MPLRDLIVFGEDWGALPSSTQHIVRHLAKSRRVIWVNSIGLRRPVLSWHDIKRAFNKLKGGAPKTVQAQPPNANFHIINPRTLPAPRSRVERWLATQLLTAQIKPVIKRTGLHEPVLWLSLPTAVDMAGRLGESALVYYCGDDFSALAGVDHQTVSQREQELITKADLIMAASLALVQRFPVHKTQLLPHGVAFSHFSTPVPRAADLPNDGRPVAGFYGSLSSWLDLELLVEVISQLPNWHFIFIGKAVINTEPLTQFSNVTLLGERPHQQLPSYNQHWSAGLLPFCDNPQIQACNPLKLQEYLAAGRPVISTPFPALKPYQHLIQIVPNAAHMVAALEQARLAGTNREQQQAVAQHSWAARALQVSEWLEQL